VGKPGGKPKKIYIREKYVKFWGEGRGKIIGETKAAGGKEEISGIMLSSAQAVERNNRKKQHRRLGTPRTTGNFLSAGEKTRKLF